MDGRAESRYSLTLFVTGATPASLHAIRNVRRLCDTRLTGRCDLSIVDIYRRPELARDEQIIAVPTLIKRLPSPVRRMIGDLSDEVRVLAFLGLSAPATDR